MMTLRRSNPLIVGIIYSVLFTACYSAPPAGDEYQVLLKKGDNFLIAGRSTYKDAVKAYSDAIALKPDEVKGYVRRADVHKLLRDYEACIKDLTFVLEKDPNNRKALELRAKTRTEAGNLVDAARDYATLHHVYARQNEQNKANDAANTYHEMTDAANRLEQIRQNKFGYAHDCVQVVGHILEKWVKDSTPLRLLRAECAIFIKDHGVAADEIRRVLVKNPNNVEALLLNARELRSLGAIDHAKQQIKRCLEYDPEFSPCRNLNKAIKQNTKLQDTLRSFFDSRDWKQVVKHVDDMIKDGEKNRNNPDYEQPALEDVKLKQCEAFFHLKDVEKGLQACDVVLDVRGRENDNSWEAYLWKADLHTIKDDLAGAEAELNNAKARGGGQQQRVHDFEQKLNNLKRQASRKNYYKILGVKKDANTNEIRKAFRTLALKYHPDKVKDVSDEERERLAALYRDINEAKEVLLDEEKRRKFDNGEDVFANQGNQGGGGFNPFQHFQHGGGGGGGFHFHFN